MTTETRPHQDPHALSADSGIQRMVEERRYCPEILQQISAVQASLGGLAELLLRGHLAHCVTAAIRSGDPERANAVCSELADLYRKQGR